jgi:hypothetical protein
MNKNVSSRKIPRGAKMVRRQRISDKSPELAAELARRGASESLVRAMGGEDAVKKFLREDSEI